MSSIKKILSILDLFSQQETSLTTEEICERMAFTKSTGFRYVRELCDVGLLARLPGGSYVLGPKIIELDYQIRASDPIIMGGKKVIQELAEETDCEVLVGSMFNDQVLIIHEEEPYEKLVNSTISRGKKIPLFIGSTSKMIIANLSRNHIKRLYDKYSLDISKIGLGSSWEEFNSQMSFLRKQGYCISHGEHDAGITGISVPIFDQNQVRGALTLGMPSKKFPLYNTDKLIELMSDAAKKIHALYENES